MILLRKEKTFSHAGLLRAGAAASALTVTYFLPVTWAAPASPTGTAVQATPATPAKPTTPVPPVIYRWISPRGQVLNLDWPVASGWVISAPSKTVPFNHPALRTWVGLPEGASSVQITGNNAGFSMARSAGPLAKHRGPVVLVAPGSPVATLTIRYKDKSGKTEEAALVLQPSSPGAPKLWVDPVCKEIGFTLKPVKIAARFNFASMSCLRRPNGGAELFIASPGAVDIQGSVPQLLAKPGATPGNPPHVRWLSFSLDEKTLASLSAGSAETEIGKILMTARVAPSAGSGTLALMRAPPPKPSRFSFSAGLGPSYLIYKEKFKPDSLTEWTLTGKVNASFWVIPGVIDLGGNAFGSIAVLSYKSTSMTGTRFYGINGRVGYKLPIPSSTFSFKISSGWYFWGMLVPDKSFGVSSLNGPQLFLTFAWGGAGRRGIFSYLKYAAVGRPPGFATNRELAAGGGFQLNGSPTKHPVMLTLDVADARFTAPTSNANEFSLLSVSLGASFGF